MHKLLLLVGAALAASSVSAAQPPVVVVADDAPFRVVNFADLNIAGEPGKQRLVARIRAAARDMCLESNIDSLEITLLRRQCFNAATNDGVAQMNRLLGSGAPIASAALVIRGR